MFYDITTWFILEWVRIFKLYKLNGSNLLED